MARNGSGTFTRIVPAYVFDTVISGTSVNSEMDGIATALTASLAKDGQTTPTANLPMGTYRHTGVGTGTARTDYAALGQVQDGSANWVDGGGTADVITATYSPVITALVDGQLCFVRATLANATTTPTFSPSGLTARTIVKNGGVALAAGDIVGDGHQLILRYDLAGTQWELLNPAVAAASDTAAGIVELATTAETTTGTDATRAVTPDGLHDMTSLAGAAWFLDEDNMASDSATKTASQQSIKAYVDTSVAAIGGVTAGTILQTANLATAATVQAHGLGATPTLLVAEIECLTAENGYSIGDRVFTAVDRMGPGGASPWGIFADATNVTALCNGNYVNQAHKSSRANVNMTMSNWKLRVTPLLVS